MNKERLERLFFTNHGPEHMDYIVQLLSLTDIEIESLQEERLCTITENYKADIHEQPKESIFGESSRKYKTHKNPYRSSDYKGFHGGFEKQKYNKYNIPDEYQPTKKIGTNNTSLNLDCTTNREQLIEEWDNEMRFRI